MAHPQSSLRGKYANPINHLAPAATGHHGKLLHGLRRSSPSSSEEEEEEDIEHGVRRKKKGMKEKIASTGVGHGHGDPHHLFQASYISTSEHRHENKGILDKFKDKLPATGNHN